MNKIFCYIRDPNSSSTSASEVGTLLYIAFYFEEVSFGYLSNNLGVLLEMAEAYME